MSVSDVFDQKIQSTLYGRLQPLLRAMRLAEKGKVALRLGDVLDVLGKEGIVLAALVLALPFSSPLSLGPVTTPASLVLMFIGWKIARGVDSAPTPERWRAVGLPRGFVRLTRRWLIRLSNRWKWNRTMIAGVQNQAFTRACGWGIFVAAFLLAVPIPLLPLTNTFPALGVVAFCLALLLQSNRWFLLGVGFCVVGSIIFAALGALVWFIGVDGILQLWDSIWPSS
ncbi:MAG: exopolysaccharide biosynthesis protein [Sumerlaeia bacterium]